MAQAITVTQSYKTARIQQIDIAWVSDASGDVELATPLGYYGYIVGVATAPGGVEVPSAYNLLLRETDAAGVDILEGDGAARSATVKQQLAPQMSGANWAFPIGGPLFIDIDTAGNAKEGVVSVFIDQHRKNP